MSVAGQVQRALKDGHLIRPSTCENCGKQGPVDGHHSDYARPLDLQWLCRSCHKRWHLSNEAANQSVWHESDGYMRSVRMPQTLADALRDLAARNDRSVSAELRVAIRAYLANGKGD